MSAALNGRVKEVENTQSTVQASLGKLPAAWWATMWKRVSSAFSLMTTRMRLVLSDDFEADKFELQEGEDELEEGELRC
jgi:hypothetical protein